LVLSCLMTCQMKASMLTTREQFQIGNSIVVAYLVLVVHDLARQEWSFKMLRHHETVLLCELSLRRPHEHVSVSQNTIRKTPWSAILPRNHFVWFSFWIVLR